jgi:hypothetical protein
MLEKSNVVYKLFAGKLAASSVGWIIFFGLVFAGVGAYIVYKYRLRVRGISAHPL